MMATKNEEMVEVLRGIIEKIPVGVMFDSHFVIAKVIQDHDGVYSSYAVGKSNPAQKNGQLARLIKRFEGCLVEKQTGVKFWSINMLGKPSLCALWLRIQAR